MNRELFLKNKIQESGYTLKDFAAFIDMPYTTLLSIINKSVGGAALDNILKICNGLNISVETLNPYISDDINSLSETKYYILNDTGKQKATEYINDLSENPKYITNKSKKTVVEDMVEEFQQDASIININTNAK